MQGPETPRTAMNESALAFLLGWMVSYILDTIRRETFSSNAGDETIGLISDMLSAVPGYNADGREGEADEWDSEGKDSDPDDRFRRRAKDFRSFDDEEWQELVCGIFMWDQDGADMYYLFSDWREQEMRGTTEATRAATRQWREAALGRLRITPGYYDVEDQIPGTTYSAEEECQALHTYWMAVTL